MNCIQNGTIFFSKNAFSYVSFRYDSCILEFDVDAIPLVTNPFFTAQLWRIFLIPPVVIEFFK